MYGFLNINKPAGRTSHDVVAHIRRLVGRGVKVGHAGTLDPAATGVLPVAMGPATRLIEYLADARKGYQAVVALGTTTTTDDAEGEIVAQQAVPSLDTAMLEAVLATQRGTIMQVPPRYAAIHHQGQRLYDLARAGKHVDPPAREVTIDRLELLEYRLVSDANPVYSLVTLAVTCSKGTYIRALARDIGVALGCGAHLAALERTFVGSFTIDHALPLHALQRPGAAAEPGRVALDQGILPPEIAVQEWPMVTLDATQCQRVLNGMPLHLPAIASERVRAHSADGLLLALLHQTGTQWHPEKVFRPA